jgi:endonuclease/exonuclease/phosphatase (EEP) superfamily protein YafD
MSCSSRPRRPPSCSRNSLETDAGVERTWTRHGAGSVLALYPILVVLLALGTWLLAPRSGALALAAILLPHLCLGAVALLPIAIVQRNRLLGAGLAVLGLVAVTRLGPDVVSLPRAVDGRADLTVATWNPLSGGTSPDAVIDRILATDAEVVAIQELTPDVAAALDADPEIAERFPSRWLVADRAVLGMGILSAYPMTMDEALRDVPALAARLDRGAEGDLVVINAHPLPGSIGFAGGIPIAFDGTRRDQGIATVRERVDRYLADGERVLLIGDFNVTPTEATYGVLSKGLRDAHAESGLGLGWTWRPRSLAGTGLGLIRIDYVLSSPELEPVGTELQCDVPGDHCLLIGRLVSPGFRLLTGPG